MAADIIHFGTDGWRGLIADDFTFTQVRRAAAATAAYIKAHPTATAGPVLVGYDRRFLSKSFAECAASVLAKENIPVLISSIPLPTPAISFSVVHRHASWGIVLTASHNPALYNGFKMKEGPLDDRRPPRSPREIEAHLSTAYRRPQKRLQSPQTFDDHLAYENYLRSRLDMKLLKQHKGRVVFDYLYGVGSGIPESVLKGTKLTLSALHSDT